MCSIVLTSLARKLASGRLVRVGLASRVGQFISGLLGARRCRSRLVRLVSAKWVVGVRGRLKASLVMWLVTGRLVRSWLLVSGFSGAVKVGSSVLVSLFGAIFGKGKWGSYLVVAVAS